MEKAMQALADGLLAGADRVTAGVSGGADSVCLLDVLRRYMAEHPESAVPLTAVHVEHGIRGEESLADMRFVEELCRRWRIPLLTVRRDVPALAKKWGASAEEAGRRVRYEAFYEAAGPNGRIAVAHHAGDQAETVLFHLARGSGTAGLAGMRPARGRVIRPLLSVTRAEIEDYLTRRGIPWRVDSTNAEDAYARNRIRHTVLPALAEVNTRAEAHICAAAERLGRIDDYLRGEGAAWLSAHGTAGKAEVSFPTRAFLGEPEVLQEYILMEAIAALGAPGSDIGAVHLKMLRTLSARQSGRRAKGLPGGLFAEIAGERFVLRLGEKGSAEGGIAPVHVPVPGEAQGCGCRIRTELLSREETEKIKRNIPEKKYTKWLDYDTISGTVLLRTRAPGDYFRIGPEMHKKKLKQYFIDEKVPEKERGAVRLLACQSHVLWVVGGRISAAVRVTEATKRILKIQILEEQS